MRILAIVHNADAGPGVFADSIAAADHQLDTWRPADGEPSPDLASCGAVLSFGGGVHPDQEDLHPWLAEEKRLLGQAVEREVPLLAVCLGAELLAEAAGGSARRASVPEIGWYSVKASPEARRDAVMASLPPRFEALEWHSYECRLPPEAVALATSNTCLQAFRIGTCAWGIQFHAEVTLGTFESWLDSYQEDPDAVRLGIEPERLRRATRDAIEGWNRIGYDLCTRFVRLAGGVPGHGAG